MSAIPPLSGDKQTSGERVVMILAGIEVLAEALLADRDGIVERKAMRRILGRRPRPLRNMISGIAHLVAEERIEAFLCMPAISAQMGPNRM
jgi:hypothetical protein